MGRNEIEVLLVEDDPMDVAAFRDALPSHYRVTVAPSLEAARKALGVRRFDCAVVDIGLPDGRGLDLVGEIQPIPVIVLTGQKTTALVEEALGRGAQDYLDKDRLAQPDLCRAIGFAIERKRYEQLSLGLEHGARLQQIGLMSAALAHEVGNPTTFVRSNLELVLQDCRAILDEAQKHPGQPVPDLQARLREVYAMATDAQEGVARIADLVHQLREVSLPTDDPAVLQRLDLLEVVHTALSVAGAYIRRRAILRTRFARGPIPVRGQPERLGQVLTNLLMNASQAIESGEHGGLVEVSVWAERGRAWVEVLDDGPGIPSHVRIESLFEPFVSTRKGAGGSGLGLPICQQIARSMGGRVELQRRGDGSRGVRSKLVLPLDGLAPRVDTHGGLDREGPERTVDVVAHTADVGAPEPPTEEAPAPASSLPMASESYP